jgi:hypothetical protein
MNAYLYNIPKNVLPFNAISLWNSQIRTLTRDCELTSADRHEDSHFPPGVSAIFSEPVAGRTATAGR